MVDKNICKHDECARVQREKFRDYQGFCIKRDFVYRSSQADVMRWAIRQPRERPRESLERNNLAAGRRPNRSLINWDGENKGSLKCVSMYASISRVYFGWLSRMRGREEEQDKSEIC